MRRGRWGFHGHASHKLVRASFLSGAVALIGTAVLPRRGEPFDSGIVITSEESGDDGGIGRSLVAQTLAYSLFVDAWKGPGTAHVLCLVVGLNPIRIANGRIGGDGGVAKHDRIPHGLSL